MNAAAKRTMPLGLGCASATLAGPHAAADCAPAGLARQKAAAVMGAIDLVVKQ